MSENKSVRLHQIEVHPGDPARNTETILRLLEAARADGVRLAVFPEAALSGVLTAQEWLCPALQQACDDGLERIVAATQGIAVLLGVTLLHRGRRIGAAVAAENGRRVFPAGSPLPYVPKQLSPENRFDAVSGLLCAGAVAAREGVPPEALAAPFAFDGFTVGAWLGRADAGAAERLAGRGAELLVRLDAVPYVRNRAEARGVPVRAAVPVVVCGAVGVVDAGKTVFVLEGGTEVRRTDGTRACAPRFEAGALDLTSAPDAPAADEAAAPRTVIRALETACRAQLARLGLRRVIVGASGGIDSALTAALYSRVAGPENLLLVNMPSRHNSQTTIALARRLAENLGCTYAEVPIEQSVRHTREQIHGLVCERPGGAGGPLTLSLSPLAAENVQARDRSGRVLSALCSAFGGVFTCNANKSEATVGYGTMYGDIAGFFAALADLWKIEVWEVARCYNREVFGREVIPQGSIDIVPSAELSPEQNVDEGKGDPLIYGWHDRLFAAWTERAEPAALEELLAWYVEGTLGRETGYEGDIRALYPDARAFCRDVEQMWRLYNGLARAKRLQAPPVLSLKNRSYGFDLGGAQLPVFWPPRYEAAKQRALARSE